MQTDFRQYDWQEFTLFNDMDEAEIRRFLSSGFSFCYMAGSQIISHQDLGETFFLMLHGLAKLLILDYQGVPAAVTLFKGGDFFGEMSLIEPDVPRSGNVVALTPVEVLIIPKKDFLRMLQESSQFSFNLMRDLARRLRHMNERMITDCLPDDSHKVAHTLYLLASKGKSFAEHGPILLPPLSLKEWALFCYTSGEVFIDSIEALRQIGALAWQNQRIVIQDMTALCRYANVYQERLESMPRNRLS